MYNMYLLMLGLLITSHCAVIEILLTTSSSSSKEFHLEEILSARTDSSRNTVSDLDSASIDRSYTEGELLVSQIQTDVVQRETRTVCSSYLFLLGNYLSCRTTASNSFFDDGSKFFGDYF